MSVQITMGKLSNGMVRMKRRYNGPLVRQHFYIVSIINFSSEQYLMHKGKTVSAFIKLRKA